MKRRRKSLNHTRQQNETMDYSFSRSLFLSVIGLLICMVCLVSTTWAWFTVSIEGKGGMIKAANYDIEVTVTTNDVTTNDGAESADTDSNVVVGQGKDYQLQGNTEYVVTLKAAGTATTGYCVVKVGDTVYHTVQIAQGDTLSFHLIPAADSNVSFTAQWGIYSGTPEITEGMPIGNLVSSSEENGELGVQAGQAEETEDGSFAGEQEESSADTVSDGELSEIPEESNPAEDQSEQTPTPPESDSGTGQQETTVESTVETGSGEMQPNQPEESLSEQSEG